LTLSICTSVWGGHGRFLGDWTRSIAAQSSRPAEVVIAELGDCRAEADRAAAALRRIGVRTFVASHRYVGMGEARNVAVAASSGEWVMHLDADDMLLPGALAGVAPLFERCDVVSLGARYANGRVRTFPHVSSRDLLAGRVGCFSCSPYRRSLWERSPYPTEPLFVDRMLWLRFAQLGARFVGTRWPGFLYRQHPGSFRRTLGASELREVRRQVQQARRDPVRVSA